MIGSDMAIDTFSERQRKAKEHLSDLLALQRGLTQWEVNFIDKMDTRALDLTPGQIKKIYEIYQERC